MVNERFLCALLCLSALAATQGTKWLIENPGFDSPDAWLSNNLPCSLEDVVFPEHYAVLPLPKTIAVKGFILPSKGALILNQDSVISLGGDEQQHSCENGKSRKAYLKAPPPSKKWFDPHSWRSTAQATQNAAIPHMEKVPCNNETVIIQGGMLSIDLENVAYLRLGELNLGGAAISRDYLKQLISNSDLGGILFRNTARVSVEYYRKDVCGCHKDLDEFVEPICHSVERTCERPHCLAPVTPYESCCAVCGAVLRFAVDSCDNGKIQKLRKLIAQTILEEKLTDELDYHINYINSAKVGNFLQAIVVDRASNYKERSVDFVKRLSASTNWHQLFGGRALPLQLALAGRPYNPNITFGSVMLCFFCLLLVSLVALVIFTHYAPDRYQVLPMRWRTFILRSPYVFARFENTATGDRSGGIRERIIMGYDTESGEVRSSSASGGGQRSFNNPLFGETPPTTSAGKIEHAEHDSSDAQLEEVPLTATGTTAEVHSDVQELSIEE